MTEFGVDFSYGRPGAAALVKAGVKFVLRYVPYTTLVKGKPVWTAKGITTAEIAEYQKAGLDIGLVWESGATRPLLGFDAGVEDAHSALIGLTHVRIAGGMAIYFGMDRNTDSTQWPKIEAYFRGVGSVMGVERTGLYGEYELGNRLLSLGLIKWWWQTRAWSGGKISDKAHLYQYSNSHTINGAAVDYDTALKPFWGQMLAPQSPPDTSTGADMDIHLKAEDWTPTVTGGQSNGVFRATPDRSAPVIARVSAATVVRSVAEVTTTAPAPNDNWRLTRVNGNDAFMLRSDWNPVTQGGRPRSRCTVHGLHRPQDCLCGRSRHCPQCWVQ